MNMSRCRIIIPVKTQIGVFKLAPTQLNKATNITEKTSCQLDQLDTRSKHGNEMQNVKREFKENSRLNND